jgi:hypothetical protein
VQFREAVDASIALDGLSQRLRLPTSHVDRVQTGVARGADVGRVVAGQGADVAVVADAQLRHRVLDGARVGLPADLVVTADDDVEPVADVQVLEDRFGEVLLAVGHQADGAVLCGDERRRVVVDVGCRRPGHRFLDLVERLPEGLRRHAALCQEAVPAPAQAVPEDLRLALAETDAEAVADLAYDFPRVRWLDVDDRAVEVEHPEVVGIVRHWGLLDTGQSPK